MKQLKGSEKKPEGFSGIFFLSVWHILLSFLLQAALSALYSELFHPVHRTVRVLSDTWRQTLLYTNLSGSFIKMPSISTHSFINNTIYLWLWLCLRCAQVYKLLYACRLLDCGLASQAYHYCEVVGQAVLRQREPFFVLTAEVIKVCTHNPVNYAAHCPSVLLNWTVFFCCFSCSCQTDWDTLKVSLEKLGSAGRYRNQTGWNIFVPGFTV